MENTIVAKSLTKSFRNLRAVDRLDLTVRSGEIYGLVGPDGAGKTTTIRLLCGVLRPDEGSVVIGGVAMNRNPDLAREQIGYLSQRFSLYEEMTVLENLRFFSEVRGLSTDAWLGHTMEILDFVGLSDFVHRRAGNLSGGMKQKLGLATALVHKPRVLLLDEPTSGVDPLMRQDFWQLIIRLVNLQGVTVLVSTPYMDEAVRCTRIGFMKNGRLVVEDRPDRLSRRLDGRIVELAGSPLRGLSALAGRDEDVEDVQMFGGSLHLRVKEGKAKAVIRRLKRTAAADRVVIRYARTISPQLEDSFIELLTGGPEGEHSRKGKSHD